MLNEHGSSLKELPMAKHLDNENSIELESKGEKIFQ